MCGILGQIELSQSVDSDVFHHMLGTLSGRGPDGEGTEFRDDGRVAFGHRRLSIIDLSAAGRQPMANEDESVWLTFNGEIYNYRELRRKLERLGHRFTSLTDSEVIVHGYEAWGDAVVDHLRGIFSFGIWDDRNRRLLLARDHLGIKPLYYWHEPERLLFASQPRAILAHPQFSTRINVNGLQQYLAYRYVPDNASIYTGMAKLPAAHRLVFQNGRMSVERFWQATYRPEFTDEQDAILAVQDAITDAVEMQLVSDVPVGVFLSGGIDSSSLATIASKLSGKNLPSFTMGFDQHAYDERQFARQAASLAGCIPHEQVMGVERFVEQLGTFVDLYDEPFFDYSGLFIYMLSQDARSQGVPVILAGDGGDELFAGYRWYEKPYERRPPTFVDRMITRFGWERAGDPLDTYFSRQGFLDSDRQRLLLPRPPEFAHRALLDKFFPRDVPTVVGLQLLDLHTFLIDDILLKVDHASMACGVEVRVPFLDRRVVETAFSIDHGLVFAAGERKALLKKALRKHVPHEILTARKKGFGAPLSQWMDHSLRKASNRLLLGGSLVDRGVFDFKGLDRLLRESSPNTIWLLLVAELWARRWLDGVSAEEIRRSILGSASIRAPS